MYRVTKLSNKYYGVEIADIADEVDNIADFLSNGDVVILGDTLEDIAVLLELELDDIEIVEVDEGNE